MRLPPPCVNWSNAPAPAVLAGASRDGRRHAKQHRAVGGGGNLELDVGVLEAPAVSFEADFEREALVAADAVQREARLTGAIVRDPDEHGARRR